jgi:hypothetical protein
MNFNIHDLSPGLQQEVTRWLLHVEWELPTLPEDPSLSPVFSGVRVARSLCFRVMFCRSLSICPFSFGHWLSVLRFMASDYPFGIFNLFLTHPCHAQLCTNKNYSYKHNEQINKQNIENSECFGVKLVKIYPEMIHF